MADLSITAANVKWNSGTPTQKANGGAAITEGQVLYRLAADNELYLADADTDAASEVEGIAISTGQNGREMLYAPAGANVNIGATTTAGKAYVLSTTAGGIIAIDDVAAPTTGDYLVILFIGTGTANVDLILAKGSVVIP